MALSVEGQEPKGTENDQAAKRGMAMIEVKMEKYIS